jgi:alginate O-acetyltransferase complex protein AlgI
MLFNSIGYILFLPVIVILYYTIPGSWRRIFLLAASYFFYFIWKAEFVLVLMAATSATWLAALKMGEIREKKKRKKFLVMALVINLGMLVAFKYLGFFTGILNDLYRITGTGHSIPVFSILIPVGISFYTFQTLGYTIDVYRGVLKPEKNIATYTLFVSFFPLVLAGPIERGRRLLPQLREQHPFDPQMISDGLRLILWGFFKKLVIADRLSVFISAVFSEPRYFHGFEIGLAIMLKMMQVYADFSGYTDIAIGSARLLGIRLGPNFDRPFSAQSISAFWSRWHISLTSWLRDYVYFSLPFKFRGKMVSWRVNLNLLITFILVGFWHGPYWNYILFGALHGTFIILANVSKPIMTRFNTVSGLTKTPRLLRGLNIIATFLLVCFTGFFFGLHPLKDSILMMRNLLDFSNTGMVAKELVKNNDFLLGVLMVVFMLWFEHRVAVKSFKSKFLGKPVAVRYLAYLAMLFFLLAFGVFSNQKFFYLQF